jgi:hypothetical protein
MSDDITEPVSDSLSEIVNADNTENARLALWASVVAIALGGTYQIIKESRAAELQDAEQVGDNIEEILIEEN